MLGLPLLTQGYFFPPFSESSESNMQMSDVKTCLKAVAEKNLHNFKVP